METNQKLNVLISVIVVCLAVLASLLYNIYYQPECDYQDPYGTINKTLDNETIYLTDEDLHYIANVQESLGEAKEFEQFLMNYDLADFPILQLFSVEFVEKILSFKPKSVIMETKEKLKEYLDYIQNFVSSCKLGKDISQEVKEQMDLYEDCQINLKLMLNKYQVAVNETTDFRKSCDEIEDILQENTENLLQNEAHQKQLEAQIYQLEESSNTTYAVLQDLNQQFSVLYDKQIKDNVVNNNFRLRINEVTALINKIQQEDYYETSNDWLQELLNLKNEREYLQQLLTFLRLYHNEDSHQQEKFNFVSLQQQIRKRFEIIQKILDRQKHMNEEDLEKVEKTKMDANTQKKEFQEFMHKMININYLFTKYATNQQQDLYKNKNEDELSEQIKVLDERIQELQELLLQGEEGQNDITVKIQAWKKEIKMLKKRIKDNESQNNKELSKLNKQIKIIQKNSKDIDQQLTDALESYNEQFANYHILEQRIKEFQVEQVNLQSFLDTTNKQKEKQYQNLNAQYLDCRSYEDQIEQLRPETNAIKVRILVDLDKLKNQEEKIKEVYKEKV